MALTPHTDQAFLREVDEALRQDQALALWQRWGRWIIAAVVLGLAVFAGVLWWQSHREATAAAQGVTFGGALDDLAANRQLDAAPKLDDLAANGAPGYAALARMVQADTALQKNDMKAAAAGFAAIAADGRVAQPLRDLALIRQTITEYDALKPQVVIDRMRPFAVKGAPYFGSAGEMTAVAHLRMGRRDLAGRMFGQLAQDDGVPASIRQRAVQMAGVLGVDAVVQAGDKTSG